MTPFPPQNASTSCQLHPRFTERKLRLGEVTVLRQSCEAPPMRAPGPWPGSGGTCRSMKHREVTALPTPLGSGRVRSETQEPGCESRPRPTPRGPAGTAATGGSFKGRCRLIQATLSWKLSSSPHMRMARVTGGYPGGPHRPRPFQSCRKICGQQCTAPHRTPL